MTSDRYHPYYVCVRRYADAGYGYLASWQAFREFCSVAWAAPKANFLVDAGDSTSSAEHERARHEQSDRDYSRQRLRTPRFTHEEERARAESLQSPAADERPFLELVLAGSDGLASWHRMHSHEARGGTSCTDPRQIHCHTPLNQRLLPAHLIICQELIECLVLLGTDSPAIRQVPPLLAGACQTELSRRLTLDADQRDRLARFGQSYLADYLGCSGVLSDPSQRRRRALQIESWASRAGNLARRARGGVAGEVHRVWDADSGVIFPESVWMQCHWFAASMGVTLSQEMALAESILELSSIHG